MHLDPKFKTNYIKIFGIILIFFGALKLYDGINALLDPNIFVILNGVERNDLEAKLTIILLPTISLIAGIIMTQIKTGAVEKLHSVQSKFWNIFK